MRSPLAFLALLAANLVCVACTVERTYDTYGASRITPPVEFHPAPDDDGVVVLPRNGRPWVYSEHWRGVEDGLRAYASVDGDTVPLELMPEEPHDDSFIVHAARLDVAPLAIGEVSVVHLDRSFANEKTVTAHRVFRSDVVDTTPPTHSGLMLQQWLSVDEEAEPDGPGAPPARSLDCSSMYALTLQGVDDDFGLATMDVFGHGNVLLGHVHVGDDDPVAHLHFQNDTLPRQERCYRTVLTDLAGNTLTTSGCIAPEGV